MVGKDEFHIIVDSGKVRWRAIDMGCDILIKEESSLDWALCNIIVVLEGEVDISEVKLGCGLVIKFISFLECEAHDLSISNFHGLFKVDLEWVS